MLNYVKLRPRGSPRRHTLHDWVRRCRQPAACVVPAVMAGALVLVTAAFGYVSKANS